MVLTSDQAIGFGKAVTGGGATEATSVADRAGLATMLDGLGNSDGPTVIELQAGTYDFRPANVTKKKFTLRAKQLTIRAQPGARVVLKNLQLVLDLGRADNILIQDLAFYSDGNDGEDAILFDGEKGSRKLTSRVRVTRCSFDGYKDIAIDSHSHQTLLLATIDHCLFFDSRPGMPLSPLRPDGNRMVFPFVDRGAVNIASVVLKSGKRTEGNSLVTVAFNVFVNVWRRCPRVAFQGNFGDIFNNIVYHWGAGNGDDSHENGTDTWNGMSVGNQGTAVIQANRFIPGEVTVVTENKSEQQTRTGKTIRLDSNPIVDIGTIGTKRLPNQFDGKAKAPTGTFRNLSTQRTNLYSTVQLGAPPTVTSKTALGVATNALTWATIVTDAGPAGTEGAGQKTPEKTNRNLVRTALGVTLVS